MYRTLPVACLALCLGASCVGDIDFDAIEPRCESPRFDSVVRNTYCSVESGAERTVSLPEGEIPVGVHSDGESVTVISIENAALDGRDGFFYGTNLNAYHANADALLDVDRLDADTATKSNLATAGTLPFGTAVLARKGAVSGTAMLTDTILVESDGGRVLHNRGGIRTPPTAIFGREPTPVASLNIAGIEDGDELYVATAMGLGGLKVVKLAWDGDSWSEEVTPTSPSLPPQLAGADDAAAAGYRLNCSGESPNPLLAAPAWRQQCVARCPDCVRDDEAACRSCRLRDSFMLPIGVGAYSVASLPDAGVFFVGGIDVYAYPIATVDPEAWDELGYELNETVGRYGLSFAQTKGYLSEPIALPDYTRAGDSSVSRVAVSMQATSNRLYVVVGDIDDEPATDTLDILVFAHQDGVIDRDVLGFFELDESLGRSLLTRIAVQPNGLATIRSLPTERNAYGAPPFATYDLLDPSAPILVATGQFENEDRFGIGGVAGLRDHILMPALDGLRMRTSSAEGGRLR